MSKCPSRGRKRTMQNPTMRPNRVTLTLTGYDGEAELVNLTATLEVPLIDSQRAWIDVRRDLVARLHAMLDPAHLKN
jgi:hypothetical protein